MEFIILLLVVIGLPLFLGIVLYNRFVALKQRRENAFADIDVQLQQRYDLVPNLIETVKGYASHEKETFEEVTNARAGVKRPIRKSSAFKLKTRFPAHSSTFLLLLKITQSLRRTRISENFNQSLPTLKTKSPLHAGSSIMQHLNTIPLFSNSQAISLPICLDSQKKRQIS